MALPVNVAGRWHHWRGLPDLWTLLRAARTLNADFPLDEPAAHGLCRRGSKKDATATLSVQRLTLHYFDTHISRCAVLACIVATAAKTRRKHLLKLRGTRFNRSDDTDPHFLLFINSCIRILF
jgi:hypothetical protein